MEQQSELSPAQQARTSRAGAKGWIVAGTAAASSLLAAALSLSDPSPPVPATPVKSIPPLPRVDTAAPVRNYSDLVATLEQERLVLQAAFTRARTAAERMDVLHRARDVFVSSVVERLAPEWVGTPWDFNGTTEEPREGSIACGYFVTTLLRDAGLPVERVRLAQQASETIILRLTTNRYVHRFSRLPLSSFVDSVRAMGPGLSIVGLDCHVGFIASTDSSVLFIHSSYVSPRSVVIEHAERSPVLAASNYRVLGRISDDDAVIRRWLSAAANRTGR